MRPDEVTARSGRLDASGMRIALVAARFNRPLVERLLDGAVDALIRHGALATDLEVAWVPGSFEVPLVTRRLARSGRFDAVVALGCVIRGETPHFDYIASEVASGCAAVAREVEVPVAFGVLTVDTWDQAVQRAGGKLGNKGAEAAASAVETANLLKEL